MVNRAPVELYATLPTQHNATYNLKNDTTFCTNYGRTLLFGTVSATCRVVRLYGGTLLRCTSAHTMLDAHFFLPPAAASQFLKVSHTNGCCGWKEHWAISFPMSECGSSSFLPPVSFPIFHTSFEILHAERPQRTKPIGE